MTKITPAEITPDLLAEMLEIPLPEVWRYAKATDRHYEPTVKIRVNGKEREIDKPKNYFKPFLKKLHDVLKGLNLFHSSAHGGIKKRSPQTSAKQHCGKRCNFTRDIKSCFPSTTPTMIRKGLCCAGFLPDTAKLLSLLLTVRGRVPQGANTSVDAINLLFICMDDKLSRLCEGAGFVYTRYVDDCVISGRDVDKGKRLVEILENEIESIGLRINQAKSKTAVAAEHQQSVQGLLVHRSSGTMIDPEKKQVALQIAHDYLANCRKLTPASIIEAAALRKKLLGHYSYFRSSTFSIAKHLKKQLRIGDRLVLRQAGARNIQCKDGKWWNSRRNKKNAIGELHRIHAILVDQFDSVSQRR